MQKMGWTYQELMDTPEPVIENIIRYMSTENRYIENQRNKNNV